MGFPKTEREYHNYYRSFDDLPFAFTDIEMIFNEHSHAVDWIFRYGNLALAKLEKVPLERLVGSSFGSLFNISEIEFMKNSGDAEKALMLYFGKLPGENN